jgi:hypothetical protein
VDSIVALSGQSSGTILEQWQRLEARMDAVGATRALREAVRALEVIHGCGGTTGEMAGEALEHVRAELEAEVDPDAETSDAAS